MIFDRGRKAFPNLPKQQVCNSLQYLKKYVRYEVVFALQINIKVSYKLISRLCTSNVSYKVVLSLLMGSHNYTSYNYNALFTRNVTYTAASFILLCLLLTCFHFSKLLFFLYYVWLCLMAVLFPVCIFQSLWNLKFSGVKLQKY